jgi:hypothetical protein
MARISISLADAEEQWTYQSLCIPPVTLHPHFRPLFQISEVCAFLSNYYKEHLLVSHQADKRFMRLQRRV